MEYLVPIAVAAFVLLVVLAGTFAVLKVGTRDISDKERVALFRAGTFVRLAGPGKVLVLPIVDRGIDIAIDDVGTALVDGRAEFGGVDIPIRSSVLLDSGDMVRIIGFDREDAAVVLKA